MAERERDLLVHEILVYCEQKNHTNPPTLVSLSVHWPFLGFSFLTLSSQTFGQFSNKISKINWLNLCNKNKEKLKKKIQFSFSIYIYITHFSFLPRIGFEFKFHVFFVSIFMMWKWKPSSWNWSSYMKA